MPKKKRNDRKLYTHNGMTMDLKEWAAHLGISTRTMRYRLKNGLSGDELFAPDKRYAEEYIGREKKEYFAKLERIERKKELNRDDDESEIHGLRSGRR